MFLLNQTKKLAKSATLFFSKQKKYRFPGFSVRLRQLFYPFFLSSETEKRPKRGSRSSSWKSLLPAFRSVLFFSFQHFYACRLFYLLFLFKAPRRTAPRAALIQIPAFVKEAKHGVSVHYLKQRRFSELFLLMGFYHPHNRLNKYSETEQTVREISAECSSENPPLPVSVLCC